VKTHKFTKHPLEAQKGLMVGTEQEYGGLVQLDLQSAAILSDTGLDDVSWNLLSLAGYAPKEAAAAILDVAVNDAGSAGQDCYMAFATPGIIQAGKTQYVYALAVNDRIGSRLVIVELGDDDKFAYMIEASGAVFDYYIKLVGWILDPSVTKPSMPSEDLKATFVVA